MEKKIWGSILIIGLSLLVLVGCLQSVKADVGEKPPVKFDLKHPPRVIQPLVSPENEIKAIENQLTELHMKSMDINNEIAKLQFIREKLEQETQQLVNRRNEIIHQRGQEEKELRHRHFEEVVHAREGMKARLGEISVKAKHNPELKLEAEKLLHQISALDEEIRRETMRRETENKERLEARVNELNRNMEELKLHRQELEHRVADIKRDVSRGEEEIKHREMAVQNELKKILEMREKQVKEHQDAGFERMIKQRDKIVAEMKNLRNKYRKNEERIESEDTEKSQRESLRNENGEIKKKSEALQKEADALNKKLEKVEQYKNKEKEQQRGKHIREIEEALKGIERHRSELEKQMDTIQQGKEKEDKQLAEKEKNLRRELQKFEGR